MSCLVATRGHVAYVCGMANDLLVFTGNRGRGPGDRGGGGRGAPGGGLGLRAGTRPVPIFFVLAQPPPAAMQSSDDEAPLPPGHASLIKKLPPAPPPSLLPLPLSAGPHRPQAQERLPGGGQSRAGSARVAARGGLRRLPHPQRPRDHGGVRGGAGRAVCVKGGAEGGGGGQGTQARGEERCTPREGGQAWQCACGGDPTRALPSAPRRCLSSWSARASCRPTARRCEAAPATTCSPR